MIALLVASASAAEAVIPTEVPIAAFSSTALAATSLSVITLTSNSSTSLMSIAKTWSVNDPSADGGSHRNIARRAVNFAVDRTGHGNHPGR